MLKQLSIYAENKKGTLEHITGVLLREEINILGSMTEDSAEYGVNRMVVSDPEKAADYARLLYGQAELMADLPLEDPAAYTALVCKLMK